MKTVNPISLATVTVTLCLFAFAAAPSHALDEPEFRNLHAQLKPDDAGSWRDLPWRLSVLGALAEAERANKPVYMLVRSGHPLGCVGGYLR